jgi:catechol 2,3-dioxygenase-like lactoylglutathione lyase family enzyme
MGDFMHFYYLSIAKQQYNMEQKTLSIRPFIGAKDFNLSREFYRDLGFEETRLGHEMSVFKSCNLAFYLQNAYVKDWIDNTMVFLEVENLDLHWKALSALGLPEKYKTVRVSTIKKEYWGKEYFVHDPSGILWHFGEFFK